VYYYYLALALKTNDQETAAISILKKAIAMQPKAEEEPLYLEMCKELLEKIE
jgi:hypothetical protein